MSLDWDTRCKYCGSPCYHDEMQSSEKCKQCFVEGRRYIWQCPNCGNQVCVNLNLLEVEGGVE